MSVHSVYSASKAERIIGCPGSVALSWGAEDSSSEAADEGTVAHDIAAMCLRDGGPASDTIGHTAYVLEDGTVSWDGDPIPVTFRRSFLVDDDMASYVQVYIDAIRRLPGQKHIEQRVDYSEVIGVPEQGGTSDAIVLDIAAEELGVHDLKYGANPRNKVFAGYRDEAGVPHPNKQLASYAAGAIRKYELLADWKTVKLAVHQPRLEHYDEFIMTVDELRAFEQSFRAAVAEAESGFHANELPRRPLSDEHLCNLGLLRPSEEACKWCPRSGNCIAQDKQVRSDAFADYDAMQVKDAMDVPRAEIPGPEEVRLVELWLAAVRKRIHAELRAGHPVKGWKLAIGQQGPRQWIKDKLAQAEKLLKKFKVPAAKLYKKTLLTPTQAENILTPEQYAELAELITRSEGSEQVVPETSLAQAIDTPDAAALLSDDSDLL